MSKEKYSKKEKDLNKVILNIEVKPANEFQKEVITKLFNAYERTTLGIKEYNKFNEVIIK